MSLILFLLALAIIQVGNLSRLQKIVISPLMFTLFFMFALEAVSRILTGSPFGDAMVYHMEYGLDGAGFDDYFGFIIFGTSLFLICLILIGWLIWGNPFRRKNNPGKWSDGIGYLSIALSIFSFMFQPTFHVIKRSLIDEQVDVPAIDFYKVPLVAKRPQSKPNVVWIYGESLERSYMDERAFPELMPNMKKLELGSLSFTNISQHLGMGWTIAGIVASQCGIPLVTTSVLEGGNAMSSMPFFLPKAVCLGDLLKREGYSLAFMGGADTTFAGKGKFLRNHGFSQVLGKKELVKVLQNSSYQTDWGLLDDSLFPQVEEKFKEMYEKDEPFGLFALTLDTHHPNGYRSNSCSSIKYADGSNPSLNAVHCSDILINELVKKIRLLDTKNNTIIVVASDHLAMKNQAYEKLTQMDANRRNLLLINWPGHIKPQMNTRADSTISSGVTVLNLMGFDVNAIGFGRSLLGEAKTLAESVPDVDKAIVGWMSELRKLWSLPDIPNEIEVDPNRKIVQFSGFSYAFPLVISFESDAKSPLLNFDAPWQRSLAEVVRSEVVSKRVLWIDSCLQMKDQAGPREIPAEGFCFFDSYNTKLVKIAEKTQFSIQ